MGNKYPLQMQKKEGKLRRYVKKQHERIQRDSRS